MHMHVYRHRHKERERQTDRGRETKRQRERRRRRRRRKPLYTFKHNAAKMQGQLLFGGIMNKIHWAILWTPTVNRWHRREGRSEKDLLHFMINSIQTEMTVSEVVLLLKEITPGVRRDKAMKRYKVEPCFLIRTTDKPSPIANRKPTTEMK